MCGAPDPAVVDAALAADRILFTLDKGIANLQRYPIHQHAGVVLFRPDTSGRSAVIAFIRERLSKMLDLGVEWQADRRWAVPVSITWASTGPSAFGIHE